MNLIRHLCGIIYIDENLCKGTYPLILLPLNDKCSLLQHLIYILAAVGCRTIWIISNDYIQTYIKDYIGDYIPDPLAYEINPNSLGEELIPIYYVKIIDNKTIIQKSEADFFFATKTLIKKTSGAISKFLAPTKWFFTYGGTLFPREILQLKNEFLSEEDIRNFYIRDDQGRFLGSIIQEEFVNFIQKNKKANVSKTFAEMHEIIPLTKITYNNGFRFENMDDYRKLLQDPDLSLFTYPEIFQKYKKRDIGISQPFIGKSTDINTKKRKGPK